MANSLNSCATPRREIDRTARTARTHRAGVPPNETVFFSHRTRTGSTAMLCLAPVVGDKKNKAGKRCRFWTTHGRRAAMIA
jgi:hypothetical protein